MPFGAKRDASVEPVFGLYSLGVVTNRDAWAYNFSRRALLSSMSGMLDFYNKQVEDLREWQKTVEGRPDPKEVDHFLSEPARRDPTRISWTRSLKGDLRGRKKATFTETAAVQSMYRPFCKQWLYFDRRFNENVYQVPRMFPSPRHANIVICTSGVGARRPFSSLVTDAVPGRDIQDTGQCFPLYVYDPPTGGRLIELGVDVIDGYERHLGVTDQTLARFQARYGEGVTKEDVFYYVYGVLNSPKYRATYGADLKKMLPRIPMVQDFEAFSTAGRKLADLHLGYERVELFPLEGMPGAGVSANQLSVVEMRFAKNGGKEDRSRIIFNSQITLAGVPEDAYRYQVDGKSAVEWVMARYRVTKDKDSGIVNDPNTWSSDPRYVVELVGRIVTVSLETMKIVDGLPDLTV